MMRPLVKLTSSRSWVISSQPAWRSEGVMNLVQMSRSLSCFLFMPKALFYARLKPSRSVARDYARLSPFALHRQGLRSAKESVKKHDVERRTRRKTLSIFSAGSAVSALYVISSHALKPSRSVGLGLIHRRSCAARLIALRRHPV